MNPPVPNLPSPADADFAQRMREIDGQLRNPEMELRSILTDAQRSRDERFAALYGVLHRMRREYRFAEYLETFKAYEREFDDQPYVETFRVVIARWTGDDPRALLRALEPAERAVRKMPLQPGVLHQYAEIVATLSESREDLARRHIDSALDRVNSAIDLSAGAVAHYFATRATLLLCTNDLDGARRDVDRAIEEEKTGTADYIRRISRYESIRLLVLMKQRQAEVERRHAVLVDELNQFKGQQLSLLSLLAALIALLAVTASVSTRLDPRDAVRLICAAGGVVALVFGGVGPSLVGTKLRRSAAAVFLGLMLVVAAAVPVLWQGYHMGGPPQQTPASSPSSGAPR